MIFIHGEIGLAIAAALGVPPQTTRIEIIFTPGELALCRVEIGLTAERMAALGEVGRRLIEQRDKSGGEQ